MRNREAFASGEHRGGESLLLGRVRERKPHTGFATPDLTRSVSQGALVEDAGEGHGLVVGPTGSGKTRFIAIANCLWFTGSLFALDIKGELAAITARRRQKLGQKLVVLDPFGITGFTPGCLNPLDMLDPESGDFVADCWMLARLITGGQLSGLDRFWDQCAEALLAGVIAYFAGYKPREECTLTAIRAFLCDPDLSYNMAVALDTRLGGSNGLAAEEFRNFLGHEGEKVRTSVRSTAMQHLSIFIGAQIEGATGATSFDLDAITQGDPISIYLVIPPHQLEAYAALVRLWTATIVTLISRRREMPKSQMLFMLDEVAQLGSFPLLRTMVTLLRGFGVRCLLFVQDLSQLRRMFAADHATVINNCSSFVALGLSSFAMAREVADALGDMGAEQLFGMDETSIATRRYRRPSEELERIDYLHDPLFAGMFDPNPLRVRQERPVERL